MRKITPYLIICLLLGASCTKHERIVPPAPGGEEKEFSFSASVVGDGGWVPLSKADVSLTDLKDNAHGNGWGVYAYYTGTDDYTRPGDAEGVIFNKRKVWWDGSAWQYYADALHMKEYWPMASDEKVTFFAFAPYSEYSESVTVDADNGPQVAYTATTDLSAQKDLLWGTNTSGLPHRNVNLANYLDPASNPEGTVDFHFRHAPAKVHFTINGAALGDDSDEYPYGTESSNSTGGNNVNTTTESAGTASIRSTSLGSSYQNRNLRYAYRTVTTTTTRTWRADISGFKILLNSVEMKNFIKDGILHLNNPDAFVPYWTSAGDDMLDYTFSSSDINTSVINPGNETTLSNGWGTTYLGVDADPKELLTTPNNYIYMVPKAADTLATGSKNISISVKYHVIGLSKTVQFTRTTTVVSYQRAVYFTAGNTNYYRLTSTSNRSYYESNGTSYGVLSSNNVDWTEISRETPDPVDGPKSDVTAPEFTYSQDNGGAGFTAKGSIASDILGGRDYTVNLYLDGRELNLTVIPQPWDLNQTVYDYNTFLNPVEQSLTYDSDFVYDVIGSNVYINNRMGKFYFKLGSGMYLYWQASLIGDDAFAFTDENGEYLRDDNGELLTSVRGNIGEEMNYIYVKAINTASQVTSRAKLRIYLFNSENRAVVALPRSNWLFVSSSYINGEGQSVQVQEWTVVQTAN